MTQRKNTTRASTDADDFTDQEFHWLTVKGNATPDGRHPRWLCLCKCGNTLIVLASSVKSGNTKSCGCRKIIAATKHGHSSNGVISPTFNSWMHMISRCSNHPNYNGRGIVVCQRWKDFGNFLADKGHRPSLKYSVDRKDNDGNYSCGKCSQCVENGWPMNVRWATDIEQARNMSTNRLITFNGETRLLIEWAERIGLSSAAMQRRLKIWPLEKALTFKRSIRPSGDDHHSRRHPERMARGENNSKSKLTDEIVLQILHASVQGASAPQIKRELPVNVDRHTVQNVINRKTWRHVRFP